MYIYIYLNILETIKKPYHEQAQGEVEVAVEKGRAKQRWRRSCWTSRESWKKAQEAAEREEVDEDAVAEEDKPNLNRVRNLNCTGRR